MPCTVLYRVQVQCTTCSAQYLCSIEQTNKKENKNTSDQKYQFFTTPPHVIQHQIFNSSRLLHMHPTFNSSPYHARLHIPRTHPAKCSHPDTRTEEHPANSNAKPFPKNKKNVKYNSASRAEVPTDPPALCPSTGPDVSRTGVPADLEGGGGVVGVPYPNPTYKSIMKACHALHYMSSDHPKICSR